MKIFLVLIYLLICSCTAEQDLISMHATQIDCENFKIEYEKVKPYKNTTAIESKIKECRNAGAWEDKK